MKAMTIKFKRSLIAMNVFFLIFCFCLFVTVFLLHDELFYTAMLLCVLALLGILSAWCFSAKVQSIGLIETEHVRRINLQYGEQWHNDVTVSRSIFILGIIYLECKLADRTKVKMWIFRDNFVNVEERYQLIRFLVLAFDKSYVPRPSA